MSRWRAPRAASWPLHPTVVLLAGGRAGSASRSCPGTRVDDGFFSFAWLLDGWPLDDDVAPALFLVAAGREALARAARPVLLLPLLALRAGARPTPPFGRLLIAVGAAGLAWLLLQGFAHRPARLAVATGSSALFGELDDRQFGMGYGALLIGARLPVPAHPRPRRARRGRRRRLRRRRDRLRRRAGRRSSSSCRSCRCSRARCVTDDGGYSLAAVRRASCSATGSGASAACTGGARCGVAWNSLLPRRPRRRRHDAARPRLRAGRHPHRLPLPSALLRALTVLPIITPPFVIGLAIILLFGRSGVVTQVLAAAVRHRSRRAGSTACPAC